MIGRMSLVKQLLKSLKKSLGLLAIVSLTLTACSTASAGREITIEMTDFALNPVQIEVKAGEQITWVLENKSSTDHEFESDAGKLEEVLVPGGKTKRVNWTAPKKAGTYEFECDMAGHDGMVMEVVVK